MIIPSKPRPSLEGEHFQVVVIGGGINGVAIARECARAGRRTLLVEEQDFASGTTSRSTRIIHGGLRYLEHAELGLVRESLRARRELLREKPNLVHPIHFLLALPSGSRRSALAIRTGLWLYRRIGGQPRGVALSEFEKKRFEQWLDKGQKWSIFSFEDAQCEFPERLVAAWLSEAMLAGAIVRNHSRVLAVNVTHGRTRGVLLRDQLTGREDRVDATWVVNATGPWVDRLCQHSAIRTKHPLIGGVRGSHIVLPNFPGAPSSPVYTEAPDGRPIFIIPWNDQILVGTTEVKDAGDPAKAAPSSQEIEYLLLSVSKMFPRAGIKAEQVRYAFAGVRPLPFAPGKHMNDLSRHHFLREHSGEGAARMISVIGGKLTTAAELARQCASRIGIATSRKLVVGMADDSVDPLLDQFVVEIAQAGSVSESSARSIVEWHGPRAVDIARMALSSAELRAPICPHSEHIVAEAVAAITQECAVTLGDILLRRVPVAWGPCWSGACSREAAMRIGAAMQWNESQIAGELESFETERAAIFKKPSHAVINLDAAAD
jgi:glycerol-3-phosphate dehydrogenase